jgi:hypothetical protein
LQKHFTMKNFVNDFYANEHEMASKEYLNAIGSEFEAIGGNFDAVGGDDWANAVQGGKSTSLPYIVTVTNGTTANKTNVPIFYANNYFGNSASLPAGVTYDVTNYASYNALLGQTMYKKFKIGKTYWTSSSSTQVTNITFKVINRDADGRELSTPIVPVLDKYAQQNTVNDSNTAYIVDGNTEVRLSTLYASQSITIQKLYYTVW